MPHPPFVGRFDDLTGPFVYVRADAMRGYPVLTEADIVRPITTELVRTLRRFGSEAVAYCILPHQAHVLVAGVGADADPRAGIRRWKQVSGFTHYERHGRRLWRERGLVRSVPDLDALEEGACYMAAAPVRAGLVRRADQYRWTAATRWPMAALGSRPPSAAPKWWPGRATSGCRTGYSLPR